MADNIDDSASFFLNNMKPDNDEEITSLWGKNIADNTGFLYFLPTLVNSFSVSFIAGGQTVPSEAEGTFRSGTMSMKKLPNFNTLHGKLKGEMKDTGFTGGTCKYFVNGVEMVRGTFEHSPQVLLFGTSFSFDVSGLTDYQDYDVSYSIETNRDEPTAGLANSFLDLGGSLWGTFT